MSAKLNDFAQCLHDVLGEKAKAVVVNTLEVTLEVFAKDYVEVALILRDDQHFAFEILIDLCGLDYSTYGDGLWSGKRFAVTSHLLSVQNNQRLRLRVFAEDDNFPSVPSVISVWNSASWYEREAFDLYGIVFPGHDDLRRLLTDYGFIGYPFRKDFPVSGHVEMRYDPDQGRVIYQPVTIEPRENTPRILRETTYGSITNG